MLLPHGMEGMVSRGTMNSTLSELIHILNLSLIFVKLIDVIIPIKTGIPDIQEHP